MSANARQIIWSDIADAPTDGTVIVTNDGSGKFEDGRWYLSSPNGSIPSCADWGREVSEITPTKWFAFPF
jgi:hypothetical protein